MLTEVAVVEVEVVVVAVVEEVTANIVLVPEYLVVVKVVVIVAVSTAPSIFSRKSDSRIANVHPFVRPSDINS